MSPRERLDQAGPLIEELRRDPLVTPCVSPHALYTVSPDLLRAAHDLAVRYDVLMTTHLSETATEVETVTQATGHRPPAALASWGMLDERLVIAHAVHLDEREVAQVAAARTAVAHCPLSNLKLGSGVAPLPSMLEAGVRVSLGTDGPVSGNDLDMWISLRLAAVLHKGVARDPTLVSAREALYLATRGGAEALGLDHQVGSLEVGKRADIILIDMDRAHLVPRYDLTSHLVYAVGRDDVRTVLIDGRVVMRDRVVLTADEPATLAAVREIADRVQRFTRQA